MSAITLGPTFVPAVPMARCSTALLVIDMQYNDASADQGWNLAMEKTQPHSTDYFNQRNEMLVIPTIAALLEFFRTQRLKVVFFRVGSQHHDLRDMPDRFRRQIRNMEEASGVEDILWAGKPTFAIRRELQPLADEMVMNKTTWSAFNSTSIDSYLHSNGIQSLVLTGVATNGCVEATARDAADRGYGCVIVDEATADYDQKSQDAALSACHYTYGRIARTGADVIHALNNEQPI